MVYSSFQVTATSLTAMGTHMHSYGIAQYYLLPGRGDIFAFTKAKLVLDFATLEGCWAELTWLVV